MYDAGDVSDIFRKQPLFERQNMAKKIMNQSSDLIPVILVRQKNENCPRLLEYKFLVRKNTTWIHFVKMIQNNYIDHSNVHSTQSLHFMIGKVYPQPTMTFNQLYEIYADQDEFLYMSYSVQDTFGQKLKNLKFKL